MKKHYSRYTPELVSKITGTPKDAFLKICEHDGRDGGAQQDHDHLYALGWTEHSVGSQNIRTMAMIQLLLGNMGMAGGGINALRGHANVQGITDMCLYSEPAGLPVGADRCRRRSQDLPRKAHAEGPAAGADELPAELPEVVHQPDEGLVRQRGATKNDFGYDWLPKKDGAYDVLAIFERMHQGKMNGFVCQGFNPLASVANKKKDGRRAGQAEVPGHHGSAGHRHLGVLEEPRRVQ
jgi:anaerobic selenocysteine-containing dehydrogenase